MLDRESSFISLNGFKEEKLQIEREAQVVLSKLETLQHVAASFALGRLYGRILSYPGITGEDVDLSLMIRSSRAEKIRHKVDEKARSVLGDVRFVPSVGGIECFAFLGYNPRVLEDETTGEQFWSSYDTVRITAVTGAVVVSSGEVRVSKTGGQPSKYRKDGVKIIVRSPYSKLLVARTAEVFYENYPASIEY